MALIMRRVMDDDLLNAVQLCCQRDHYLHRWPDPRSLPFGAFIGQMCYNGTILISKTTQGAANTCVVSNHKEGEFQMATSDSTIPLKRCSICGLEFPATTEFFYRNHNGLRADCKNCRRAYDKRRYDRVRDHRLLQMRQWYAENRDYKLEQSRLWHEANKEYRRLYKKEWYATHRNYALEYMRNYRVLNLDEVRARNRDWHYQNLHRSRKSHREWYKANPERSRVYSARRRSRIKASGEQFNAIDVLVQFKSQKGLCWWCEKPLDPDNYHIDHRVPISKGGGNSAGQIVISCPTCNLSKKDKMPWEWIGRLL